MNPAEVFPDLTSLTVKGHHLTHDHSYVVLCQMPIPPYDFTGGIIFSRVIRVDTLIEPDEPYIQGVGLIDQLTGVVVRESEHSWWTELLMVECTLHIESFDPPEHYVASDSIWRDLAQNSYSLHFSTWASQGSR